jgi:hypothetical protein
MKFSREFITSYNGEIINIPEEEILSLRVGDAWCKIGQHSFEMKTYLADSRPRPPPCEICHRTCLRQLPRT